MNEQLYLFPEIASSSASSGKKAQSSGSAEKKNTSLPGNLSVSDFLVTPDGGFHESKKLFPVPVSDLDMPPIEFVFSFMREYAPTHSLALAKWNRRFLALQTLVAEEYVRLHAETEKIHPEWFEGGDPVRPTDRLIPFVGTGYTSPAHDTVHIENVYGLTAYEQPESISLSLCAGLIEELGIHYPVLNKKYRDVTWDRREKKGAKEIFSEETLYQFSSNVAVEYLKPIHMKKHGCLVFHTENMNDLNQPNHWNTNSSHMFPAGMPEPFGTLSLLYARKSLYPLKDICFLGSHRVNTQEYDFRLFTETTDEREREMAELEGTVHRAMSEWKTFRKNVITEIRLTAENNNRMFEKEMMSMIDAIGKEVQEP